MAPLLLVDSIGTALASHSTTLQRIARVSISDGLDGGAPTALRLREYSAIMRETMASFVTLRQGKDLRGCVGTTYAVRSLVEDVSQNAFFAAFSDTRFPPLKESELDTTSIEISVLTPPVPLLFDDEDDLTDQLVPGRDGLVLEYNHARGLLLPQVWEKLSDPRAFLDCLKAKAGLPAKPLDPAVRALRFEAVKL